MTRKTVQANQVVAAGAEFHDDPDAKKISSPITTPSAFSLHGKGRLVAWGAGMSLAMTLATLVLARHASNPICWTGAMSFGPFLMVLTLVAARKGHVVDRENPGAPTRLPLALGPARAINSPDAEAAVPRRLRKTVAA